MKRLNLIGDVEDSMLISFLEDVRKADLTPGDELVITVSTSGGDIDVAFAVYDLMRSLSHQGVNIVTLGLGSVASAGSIIFMAGDQRVLYPHSHILIHFGEESSSSAQEKRHYSRQEKQMRNIYATRAKVTPKKATMWLNKETYLTAEEAVKNGIATKVLSENE